MKSSLTLTNQVERLLLAFEPLESAPLQDVLLELKGLEGKGGRGAGKDRRFRAAP